MGRTIVVGDVHACIRELRDLLERVGLTGDDRLVMVGDVLVRGPDSIAVLDLLMQVGAQVVRGNHEHKLLLAHNRPDAVRLGPAHRKLLTELKDRHWRFLRATPLWLDLPEHDLRVVHAGVVPGVAIEDTDPDVIMTMRGLTERGQPSQARASELWGKRYQGPPHVVFGHNALMAPQVHTWATGIDTGCVYGGFLTALVLSANQRVPPIYQRSEVLVMVPARRTYYPVRNQRVTA